MKDLISIDDLTINDIDLIHKRAEFFHVNFDEHQQILNNKILVNFFFENSTRTRMSFEIAGKKMGVKVINLDISLSSLKKGESITDTALTINAMKPDFVAIRHNSSGIISLLKKYINCSLINAGDGTNEHPSQALLDSFVIKKYKGNLGNLKIAICGDVLHSRVARSNIKLLKKYNCQINVVTPSTLVAKDYEKWLFDNWNIRIFHKMEDGLKDADVIMMLRIQQERMLGSYISSPQEYFKFYGLTHQKIENANNPIIMHPGPINREVEISSQLADDKNISLILEQVTSGVATRQAILEFLAKN
ncbi:MAG: aspartate carbamoyltransferase catalytic subunit [Alphaproteobacteria bacterium]